MPKFAVMVVYPVYFDVEADNIFDANDRALEQCDNWFERSSIKPVVHDIYEMDEDGNRIDEEVSE
jgi:NADPH:quinone reductase-like Zn-dependent oxidoreductase